MKVQGPYLDKSTGRLRVFITEDNGHRTTMLYSRYLMSQHLGRKLETWEQVDHVNEDKTDDRVENFQILTKSENSKKNWETNLRPVLPPFELDCLYCGQSFIGKRNMERLRIRRGAEGPYCSVSCARRHAESRRK